MKTFFLVFLILSLASPVGEACGPFQWQVVRSDGNVSRGPAGPPDTFAGSANKGNELLSDSPFFFVQDDNGGFDWSIDVRDSYLVKQNTLLEIKGYLEKLPGIQLPADFLSVDKIDDNLAAFSGVSARKVLMFGRIPPEPPALVTPDDVAVNAALGRAFPEELHTQIFNAMRKQQAVPVEENHFSRRSFLSSETVKKTFGGAAILACMAFGYASDAYLSEDESVRELGPQMAARSLQSSVIDYLASEAFRLEKNGKEPAAAEILLAKGEIACALAPTKDYALQSFRCGNVTQTDPVVRRGTVARDLFVQLGRKLYSAKCTLPGGKQIDLSAGQPLDFDELLRKSDFDPKKPVEKFLADNLKLLTKRDKLGVMAVRGVCDQEIRRLERAAAVQSGTAPHRPAIGTMSRTGEISLH